MDPLTWLTNRLFAALEAGRINAFVVALSRAVSLALGLSFAALAVLLQASGADAYSVGSLVCFSAAGFVGGALCGFVHGELREHA